MRNSSASASASWTKSMLQRSTGPAASGAGPRGSARCLRRRTRIRTNRPSSRYSRRTRLWFTTQPSRRSRTQMRRYPNRGRACAISRSRMRSADWSFARLGRYQAARLNPANRQVRTQLTWNAAWNHAASSRRRTGLSLFFGAPPTACACRTRGRRRSAHRRVPSASSVPSLPSRNPEAAILLQLGTAVV